MPKRTTTTPPATTREELVQQAKRMKITHSGKTKEQIETALDVQSFLSKNQWPALDMILYLEPWDVVQLCSSSKTMQRACEDNLYRLYLEKHLKTRLLPSTEGSNPPYLVLFKETFSIKTVSERVWLRRDGLPHVLETFYSNGKKQGVDFFDDRSFRGYDGSESTILPVSSERFYTNGQLKSRLRLTEKKPAPGTTNLWSAWWESWHENGQLESEGRCFMPGMWKKGVWTTWHDNGQMESRGEYFTNNEKFAKWEYWDRNGVRGADIRH